MPETKNNTQTKKQKKTIIIKSYDILFVFAA